MIVNEIAKFEKPLHAAVEVLLEPHLGELALVLVLELIDRRHPCVLPSSEAGHRVVR